MQKKALFILAVFQLALWPSFVMGQEGIKVVPIGQTIQPEGGGDAGGGAKPRKKRVVVPQAMVKPGKTFMIESASVLSSGITLQGDVFYFRAAEDVGGVIAMGALGKGKVTSVDNTKKSGKLVVQVQSINAVNDEAVNISGDVTVEGKGGQAAIGVGERFTATVDEKTVIRKKPKKKETPPPNFKQGFAEIRGKDVKADIKKGQAKGKIQVLIEPPKGVAVDDLDPSTLALVKVNGRDLPEAVQPLSGKITAGDRNKNGTSDLAFEFNAWDFIKFQPRGLNTVVFKGKIKDGTEYEASAKATIDY